jgi:hypothetical protein
VQEQREAPPLLLLGRDELIREACTLRLDDLMPFPLAP